MTLGWSSLVSTVSPSAPAGSPNLRDLHRLGSRDVRPVGVVRDRDDLERPQRLRGLVHLGEQHRRGRHLQERVVADRLVYGQGDRLGLNGEVQIDAVDGLAVGDRNAVHGIGFDHDALEPEPALSVRDRFAVLVAGRALLVEHDRGAGGDGAARGAVHQPALYRPRTGGDSCAATAGERSAARAARVTTRRDANAARGRRHPQVSYPVPVDDCPDGSDGGSVASRPRIRSRACRISRSMAASMSRSSCSSSSIAFITTAASVMYRSLSQR